MSAIDHLSHDSESLCATPHRFAVPPLYAFVALNTCLSLTIFAAFTLSVTQWSGPAVLISILVLINAIWISGGAATAILGLLTPAKPTASPSPTWQPDGKTAILIALCGEDPEPLAGYLATLTTSLSQTAMHHKTEVFVLSDTSGPAQIAQEDAALATLIATGRVTYRRRATNTDKKPGNITDWLHTYGAGFDYMAVLDADSRMTADSIQNIVWRLEQRPGTGLLQAGIALIPGRTRFGKHQRIASRLLSRNFGRGFAAWTGKTANYWGHNAIMRVAAFRTAAPLPRLSGSAPFGGAILSHDFVEAAAMRRAGWDIELAHDVRGSAEDAPQTLAEYFRRDRRWCQGNLQHLRVLGQPGLHGRSRFHFVTGILSYVAAPIWLLLVLLLSFGGVSVSGYAPVICVAIMLLVPKVCALIDILPKTRTWRRRRVFLKVALSELVVSALVAPLVMMRHAAAVCSVMLGRDCGWKSPRSVRWHVPQGWTEGVCGIIMLWVASTNGPAGLLWLSPIFLPLLSGPVLVPMLNRSPL